jgi:hypothetical protein
MVEVVAAVMGLEQGWDIDCMVEAAAVAVVLTGVVRLCRDC